jgi:hypothetical protein
MKAKTLLIAAATLAVGAISSQAQVYSQNVVGYINVTLTNGYTMICNQLDGDGTGTNNSIYTVVGTNVPVNTAVLAWNGSAFTQSKWTGTKWTANSALFTNAMNPGSGFFVNSPALTNITLVGQVIQGTNKLAIAAGYQIVSPVSPVAGGIGTVNGYSPTKNDAVLIWNGAGYVQHKWTGTLWTSGEPSYNVGQGFFLNAAGPNTWTNVLNIH